MKREEKRDDKRAEKRDDKNHLVFHGNNFFFFYFSFEFLSYILNGFYLIHNLNRPLLENLLKSIYSRY